MNNYQCSVSEREEYRKDYSPEFMADAMERGTQHGHDPRNSIGMSCGVSWHSIYRLWDDIWLYKTSTYEAFRNYLRNPSEDNLRMLHNA